VDIAADEALTAREAPEEAPEVEPYEETVEGPVEGPVERPVEETEEGPEEEPPPRPRMRRWPIVAAVGLVVVLWALLSLRVVLQARSDLHAGVRSVDQARQQMTPSALASGRPVANLRQAQADFTRADHELRSSLLIGIHNMPVLGRQIQALQAVSAGAARVASITAGGVTSADSILSAPAGPLVTETRVLTAMAAVGRGVQGQLKTVRLGPGDALIAPVAQARQKLAGDISQLQSALQRGLQGSTALEDLLTGSHHFLVFAANNAEMRAGSGMFLTAGVLSTGSTGLSLGPMQTVTTIAVPGGVPLSGDLAARWAWLDPNQEWRNLMVSPRFDVSAKLAAQMWVASGHPPVDGVISLDAVALQGVLQATGPVDIAGRQITAKTVVDELLNIQYYRYDDTQTSQRREELGQIAAAAFGDLASGGWSAAKLGDGLLTAAQGRHILVWSQNAGDEAGWRALGIDGTLSDNSLMLSVLNRGGNKLDYFLRVSSNVTFRTQGQNTEVTMQITLHNEVPSGEPFDVIGPDIHSGVAAGVYVGILSINMPADATDGHFDGVDHLAVAGTDGPSEVMAFQLQVNPGQTLTVVAHFLVPTLQGSLRVEPSARVPGTLWTSGSYQWHDVIEHTLKWSFPGSGR
jgi:hypothetical protein